MFSPGCHEPRIMVFKFELSLIPGFPLSLLSICHSHLSILLVCFGPFADQCTLIIIIACTRNRSTVSTHAHLLLGPLTLPQNGTHVSLHRQGRRSEGSHHWICWLQDLSSALFSSSSQVLPTASWPGTMLWSQFTEQKSSVRYLKQSWSNKEPPYQMLIFEPKLPGTTGPLVPPRGSFSLLMSETFLF